LGKTAQDNFIHNRSEIIIGIELKLPLELMAEDLQLERTIPFDMFSKDPETSGNENDGSFEFGIQEASLAYRIKNGFPLDATIRAILYDSINDVKYDTVDIGLFTAAPVDEFGVVIPAQIEEKEGLITIDEKFVDNLRYNTNSLIIIGSMNTTKNNSGKAQSVKILTTYNIEFKAGLAAKVSIKTSTNK
jgi:hypothetical protein